MRNQFSILSIALAICLVQAVSNNQAAIARGHGGGHTGHGGGEHSIGGRHAGNGSIAHEYKIGGHEHLRLYRAWYAGGYYHRAYVDPYGAFFDDYGNSLDSRPAVTSTPFIGGSVVQYYGAAKDKNSAPPIIDQKFVYGNVQNK